MLDQEVSDDGQKALLQDPKKDGINSEIPVESAGFTPPEPDSNKMPTEVNQDNESDEEDLEEEFEEEIEEIIEEFDEEEEFEDDGV
jgi:hypothetical protein